MADWSDRAVNTIGSESGLALHYDRSAVTHWLSGTHPQVSDLITEAFSRKLGRAVLSAEVGLTESVVPVEVAAAGTDAPAARDAITALTTLANLDVTAHGHAVLRRQLYQLSALDIRDWSVARRSFTTDGRSRWRGGPLSHDQSVADVGRHLLAVFAELDHRFGSGHARVPLIACLAHDVTTWLRARTPDSVREDVFGVATDLTYLAGFRCVDDHAHGLAQRYYLVAPALAVHANDPVRYAIVLRGLSHHAHYLGHHRQALALATTALRTAPPHIRPTPWYSSTSTLRCATPPSGTPTSPGTTTARLNIISPRLRTQPRSPARVSPPNWPTTSAVSGSAQEIKLVGASPCAPP